MIAGHRANRRPHGRPSARPDERPRAAGTPRHRAGDPRSEGKHLRQYPCGPPIGRVGEMGHPTEWELAVTDPNIAASEPTHAQAAPNEDWDVERVLVVFKTHLDIGYTDFAASVRRQVHQRVHPKRPEDRPPPARARRIRAPGVDRRLLPDQRVPRPRPGRRQAGDGTWHPRPATSSGTPSPLPPTPSSSTARFSRRGWPSRPGSTPRLAAAPARPK